MLHLSPVIACLCGVHRSFYLTAELLCGLGSVSPHPALWTAGVDSTTGVHSFWLPALPCRILDAWCSLPQRTGGGIMLGKEKGDAEHRHQPLDILVLPPYMVSTVAANPGVAANPSAPPALSRKVKDQQSKRNGMSVRHARKKGHPRPDACLEGSPVLRSLVYMALVELGLSMQQAVVAAPKAFAINFFLSDETDSQGYTWHTDCMDLVDPEAAGPGCTHTSLYGLRTCVVQLGDMDQTGMCLLGYKHHVYTGRGAAVWFPGSAPHRSMLFDKGLEPPQKPVWKVSFFFRQQDLPVPECNGE